MGFNRRKMQADRKAKAAAAAGARFGDRSFPAYPPKNC